MNKRSKQHPTSWEKVSKWYHGSVGEEGHYYHKQIIIPGILRLMNFTKTPASVLDVACGQGVLARHLPESVHYTGIDASASLIKEAKKADSNPLHEYIVADATKPLPKLKHKFTHAAIVLALQNIARPDLALKHIAEQMNKDGQLVVVLNHPCFRIPRQSSWQVDQEKKIQYRRIDRYFSPMEIPIQAHPGKGAQSVATLTFHHSISAYSEWLYNAGFCIAKIEEWCSDKVSTGSAAKMENRSRAEFPLFMALSCKKI